MARSADPPATAVRVRGLRLAAARAVWSVHVGLMLFLLVGWSLPWRGALLAAAVVYPLVLLNWWSFDNRCLLTIAEERLRRPHGAADGRSAGEPLHFVAAILSKLLGRPVSAFWGDVVSYGVVCSGFAVASLRLLLRS